MIARLWQSVCRWWRDDYDPARDRHTRLLRETRRTLIKEGQASQRETRRLHQEAVMSWPERTIFVDREREE